MSANTSETVTGVSVAQWQRLRDSLAQPNVTYATPESVMVWVGTLDGGLSYAQALAMLMIAPRALRVTGELMLLAYHCSDMPIEERPLSEGFKPTPCACPKCGERIRRQDDLFYDHVFRVQREPAS